ncbi:hypothetical protein H312_00452 [Anncaliia algerae PRA339]|uniref:ISXO2-like transposase domain-containing protein n=1 Tax=Anncaliia algerae PRA339 TaxID=1288291 RepID=A0A059F5B5_9MICR|nr:hypothetical protein H312_00452 [Anncaliia algerae PRA339]
MELIVDEFEREIIKLKDVDQARYLMEKKFLSKEYTCQICKSHTKLSSYTRNVDLWVWRCMNRACKDYLKYFIVRNNSFFMGFRLSLRNFIRVIIKFAVRQSFYSLKNSLDVDKNTVEKIIKNIKDLMPNSDYKDNILGEPDVVVQIDETMLNFKVNGYYGRSTLNKTDSLCIVEVKNGITLAFDNIIEN